MNSTGDLELLYWALNVAILALGIRLNRLGAAMRERREGRTVALEQA